MMFLQDRHRPCCHRRSPEHTLPPPFRVPPFLLGVAVRQKGLVTLRCCRRQAGGKQQSTGLLHLNFRVPFIGNTKTVYPRWDTPFLVRVFLWNFSKNAVIPTFFGISEHQISLFTSQNAPEIFLGLAAQNGIVVTPRHLFYFNLLSLSL